MPQTLKAGAVLGLAYGVWETLFFALVPGWELPAVTVAGLHTGTLLVLLVAYPMALAFVAVMLGFLGSKSAPWSAVAALGALWLVALSVFGKGDATLMALQAGAALLLLAGLLLARREPTSPFVRTLGSPWVASLAVCTASWVAGPLPLQIGELSQEYGSAVLGFALVLGATWWWYRQRGSPSLRAQALVVVLGAGFVVVANLALNASLRPIHRTESQPWEKNGESPNVVLVTLDTVRADHLSLYGYERSTTPYLEELAPEARVYRRAIAPANMTLASHASMFTGLYPSLHHAHTDRQFGAGRPLGEGVGTIAEHLRSVGYETAGVVANFPYLVPEYGLSQGMDYYDSRRPIPLLAQPAPFTLRRVVVKIGQGILPRTTYDVEFRTAEQINEAVSQWFAGRRETDRPFFLFVNYMDAHWPTLPPPPFSEAFGRADPALDTAAYKQMKRDVMTEARDVTQAERDSMVTLNDGALAYLDSELRTLIERLDQISPVNRTLLIIASDHGEAFGRRNYVGHGASLYQDAVHVPLLIRWPGHAEPGWQEEPVSLVDIFPTVLGAAGVMVDGDFDGIDLLPEVPVTIPPDTSLGRIVVAESFPDEGYAEWSPRYRKNQLSVQSRDLKLIYSTDGSGEFFDISRDPEETSPIKALPPLELTAWLNNWLAGVEDSEGVEREDPDQDQLDALQSLGYVH